jgi:hypothetical protein
MPEIMRPGDTLLIGIPAGLVTAHLEDMKEKFREKFPGVEPVFLVGLQGAVIYRPEATDA